MRVACEWEQRETDGAFTAAATRQLALLLLLLLLRRLSLLCLSCLTATAAPLAHITSGLLLNSVPLPLPVSLLPSLLGPDILTTSPAFLHTCSSCRRRVACMSAGVSQVSPGDLPDCHSLEMSLAGSIKSPGKVLRSAESVNDCIVAGLAAR